MGFNIKNNYGPNIEVNEGGVVNLNQDKNGHWTTEVEEAQIVEESQEERQVQECVVSEMLKTTTAERCWVKLYEAGFVDAKYKLLPGTTRKQAAYIAECFAEKLGINSKWKTFEDFWGISNMAQEMWDIRQTGILPKRSKEIDKIFEV